VRRDGTLPESAQRRNVLALTPSSSAACCTRSHSVRRACDTGPCFIIRSIGAEHRNFTISVIVGAATTTS
jgi:hypothetical protein